MQALASNPLQAAVVGNAAVVSVAERYVLLSGTQVNVFVKPNRVRGTGILTLNISVVKLIIGKTEVFCEERL